MYKEFYGLNQEPFRLTPDPEFFFLGEDHNKSLAHLLYGINNRKGFIALTGEVGAGKTTLCRLLLKQLDEKVSVAIILNSLVDELTFLKQINRDFSIPYETNSHDDLVSYLYDFLIEEKKKDKNVLIIVDECQNLKFEVLEQIRMLSNLETEKDKLLQILLIGQPEFLDMLNSHELRQLNQRITVRAHISAFKLNEMEKYIYHRLAIAGNVQGISFDKKALKMIFDYSKGIPRRVNVLCDYALLAGYVAGSHRITANEIKKAIQDIEIKRDKQFSNEEVEKNNNNKRNFRKLRVSLLTLILIFMTIYFKDILLPGNSLYYKKIVNSVFVADIVNAIHAINDKNTQPIITKVNEKENLSSDKNVSIIADETKVDSYKESLDTKVQHEQKTDLNIPIQNVEELKPLIIDNKKNIEKSNNSIESHKETDESITIIKEEDKLNEALDKKTEIKEYVEEDEKKEIKIVPEKVEANILKNPTSVQGEQYFNSLNYEEKGLWLLLSSWGIEINHPRMDLAGRIASLSEQLERFNFSAFSSWADLSLIVKINIPCTVEVLINNEKHHWVLNGVKDNFLRFHIAPGKYHVITVDEFKDIWQGNSFFIVEKGEFTIDGQDVIFKGMENSKVEQLSNILNKLGFLQVNVQNVFDLTIEQSVIDFQTKMGLTADGIISVEAKLLFYSMLSKNIPRILSKG